MNTYIMVNVNTLSCWLVIVWDINRLLHYNSDWVWWEHQGYHKANKIPQLKILTGG